jgi:hypothetical protein
MDSQKIPHLLHYQSQLLRRVHSDWAWFPGKRLGNQSTRGIKAESEGFQETQKARQLNWESLSLKQAVV